jgi:hypothetical protein
MEIVNEKRMANVIDRDKEESSQRASERASERVRSGAYMRYSCSWVI